ncbi:hypothetical protein J6590_045324 [Homalodisca vitripennis]|nr:hypothetical protein J6590_045324 [Homalodisca vitripennis]
MRCQVSSAVPSEGVVDLNSKCAAATTMVAHGWTDDVAVAAGVARRPSHVSSAVPSEGVVDLNSKCAAATTMVAHGRTDDVAVAAGVARRPNHVHIVYTVHMCVLHNRLTQIVEDEVPGVQCRTQ